MTISPYALVQMTVDGVGPQFGGLTLAGGNVIQLSGVSNVGWTSQLWEIFEYPTGFALPSGWTNVNGIYTSSSVTPSNFTISAAGTRWGKYLWRLTVNGGLLNGVFMGPLSNQPHVDELSGVKVLSPNYALHDIGFRETNQFDSVRQWIGDLKKTLRLIDSIVGGGGAGFVPTGTGYVYIVAGVMQGAATGLTWTGDATGTGTGTSFALTVVKVNGASVPAAGALVTGNGPYVSGISALTYSALNLAGGAGWVTGVLPSANMASHSGDVTGTHATTVVVKVNGATIPSAGALTTGNAPYVSGISALTYSALNLAGGAGWVTGALPLANQAAPTGSGFVTVTGGAWDSAATAFAAGVATFLGTPTSANFLALMTDETGTGLVVFGTSPTFKSSFLLNNPANTFAYTFSPAAIAAGRTITLPLLGASDTMVCEAFAQTLTNKTMVLASNTLTDTSAAIGDILRHDGTRFVRLARGSANQVLTVNAGATDIAWAAAAGGGGSTPTGTGFYHTTAGVMDVASKKVDLTASADVTVPATANGIITSSGTVLQQALNVLAGSGFISVGAIVATGGAFRLANTGAINARNAANSADINIANVNGSNLVQFGDATNATSARVSAATDTGLSTGSTSAVLTTAAFTITSANLVLNGTTTSTTNDTKGTATDYNPVRFQTTDATVTTLASFTIPTGTSSVSITVVATKSDNSQGAVYSRSAAFRNNAGTVAQIGVTQDGGTFEDDAVWDCTIDNSTTTCRVRITGKAATTIQWTCTMSVVSVIP